MDNILTASVTLKDGFLPEVSMGTLSYQWYVGNYEAYNATQASYTPTEYDAGKTISVRISAANYAGEITAFFTGDTTPPTPPPEPPTPPINTFIRGDVNGDGTVNAADRIYLARYLANWPGYTLD